MGIKTVAEETRVPFSIRDSNTMTPWLSAFFFCYFIALVPIYFFADSDQLPQWIAFSGAVVGIYLLFVRVFVVRVFYAKELKVYDVVHTFVLMAFVLCFTAFVTRNTPEPFPISTPEPSPSSTPDPSPSNTPDPSPSSTPEPSPSSTPEPAFDVVVLKNAAGCIDGQMFDDLPFDEQVVARACFEQDQTDWSADLPVPDKLYAVSLDAAQEYISAHQRNATIVMMKRQYSHHFECKTMDTLSTKKLKREIFDLHREWAQRVEVHVRMPPGCVAAIYMHAK